MKRMLVGILAAAALFAQQWSATAQTANSYVTPQQPLAAAPVTITNSTANATLLNCTVSQVQFTGAINGNNLNVSAVASGTLTVGGTVSGAGVYPGTIITAQASGTAGSTGNYVLSVPPNNINYSVASETLYETYSPGGCEHGAILEAINVTLTDTSAHTVAFYFCTSSCPAASDLIGTVSVPASSGNTTSALPINVLSAAYLGPSLPVDSNGNRYLFVPRGSYLTVTDSSSASGKTLTLTPVGGAY